MGVVQVIAIVGPTAAGKSDLGVDLALDPAMGPVAAPVEPAGPAGTATAPADSGGGGEAGERPGGEGAAGDRLGGEIVNADSMQLYRGMDIGTAKLTQGERRGVPHHLLDVWDITTTASVAEYQRAATAAVAAVWGRGRMPILVGGSGLYVRAALGELEFPGTDPDLRARLEAELAATGPEHLHRRLRERDPAAADAILPRNGRRIVRALEVIEITGRPFTATLPRYDERADVVQVGVEVPRPVLDERIEARVDRMFAAGFVDEVRALERQGLRDGLTAGRALGYAQVLRHLAGEWSQERARAETVRATRRFARKQESWFRRDPRVRWLPYDAPDLAARVRAMVAPAAPGEAARTVGQ
jgi:tRNA dimethylallyltransferase